MKLFKSIFLISIFGILIYTPTYSQKKLKTAAELKKAKTYRSVEEATLNKRRVYILNLDGHQLTEIPDVVFKLKNLQELYLRNNKIDSLPDELWALTNLQKYRIKLKTSKIWKKLISFPTN